MNLAPLLNGVGSIGLFSSRVFLPAFVTALMLRFGPQIPALHHLGLLQHLHHNEPTWFTNNITLAILGILSGLETFGQKSPEIRRLLHEFDIHLKTVLAALTSFGVIRSSDSDFVQHLATHAGYADAIIPLIAAIGTWRVARARRDVVTMLFDHVEGTHLDRLISWLEEAWVLFGGLLLILFPVLMLLMVGLATGILYLIRRRMQRAEEHSRLPCAHCGESIYPSAFACPKCRQAVAVPAAIGFLGQSLAYPTDDIGSHPLRLQEKRRCSSCATRLPSRKPFEPCKVCSTTGLADARFAEDYVSYISRRLPVVLMVCALMSLVPIFGMIVGAVYYRIELVLPFSQYLPLGRRFLLRWGIRLLFIIMIFLQVIPVVGGLIVPIMALISFTAYRRSFLSYVLQQRDQRELPPHDATGAVAV
jgi:hypothetical protein